jgi:predicted RNA binding protein YcfA (HicA-like mRNA interferase family)
MIAEEQVTIEDLVRLLRELGFVPRSRFGNGRWFRHPSGAEILLPVNPSANRTAIAVFAVRAHLDGFGTMDRHEFDEWMWRLAIARKDTASQGAPGNGKKVNGKPRARAGGRLSKAPARRAAKPPPRPKVHQPSH